MDPGNGTELINLALVMAGSSCCEYRLSIISSSYPGEALFRLARKCGRTVMNWPFWSTGGIPSVGVVGDVRNEFDHFFMLKWSFLVIN